MTKVKICGITAYPDAAAAIDYGADALGFIFSPSPRQTTPENARNIIRRLPPFVVKVGVFVNAPAKKVRMVMAYCGLSLAQLQGNESRAYYQSLSPFAIKAFRAKDESVLKLIKQYGAEKGFLLDAFHSEHYGGTGELIDIALARQAAKIGRMILAGGLTPYNVAKIIRAVKPYGVDVASGVEKNPGKKDRFKMRAFIRAVKD
jgi:phosphoribosylanthranilate isomerase